MPKSEPRDQFGKFTRDLPLQSPPPGPSLPANPSIPSNFFLTLWHKLTKLSLKKLLTIGATVSLILTNGPFQNIVEYFFPYSSPILHRQTAHQGEFKTFGN